MSNFRTKLLGLAAFATVFAGMSFGQGITGCTSLGVTPGPTNMRAEGTTELAGDVNFNCTNGSTSSTATVTVFATAPITSQLLANNTSSTGARTEAVLFICAGTGTPAPSCTSGTGTPNYGTISGNQINFTGVTIPGTSFSGLIQNVRMNASAVTVGTTLTTVTETILASANNTSAATPAVTTGFVFQSLAAPSFALNPTGTPSATITSYQACVGNALPTAVSATVPRLSFGVNIAETFGGAFKTAAGEAGTFVAGDATKAGAATFGTRIQLVFNNVAASETIYVPTTITNTLTGGNTLSMTLTSSATGALTPVAASTTTGAPGASTSAGVFGTGEIWGASAGLTASGGTVTAVYEVTNSIPGFIQGLVVPVWVTFGANVFTTVPATITVLESYAPTATAAAATTVPSFIATSNTPLNATTITLCQTSLLFPFVTNQLGFDTGIAFANTTTDPFRTTPVPGTCVLNFYGTGAPTPSTGINAPGGTQQSGTVNAFLLSAVAPGFQGYVIAQCNYVDAYGYAFIAYNLTQNNGAVQGYIAPQLNRPGGASSIGQ